MAKKIDMTPDDLRENQGTNSDDSLNDSSVLSSLESDLTEVEEKDINKINVTITDPSPIIVLFGAGASGKTMTLVRLTNYLIEQGGKYKVEPVRTFRPGNSKHYQKMCDTFGNVVRSTDAPARTRTLSFMLVKVMDKWGKPICQILEAPGEHYFDHKHPEKDFPKYIKHFKAIKNPKTWVFIVEKDWLDQNNRNDYSATITKLQNQYVSHKDRVIFTCHKADLHDELFVSNVPNKKQFFDEIKNQYPGIFSKYLNHNPITKLYREYNFDFVVFSAGLFSNTDDGGQTYVQNDDKYPAKLWKSIMKTVNGGW